MLDAFKLSVGIQASFSGLDQLEAAAKAIQNIEKMAQNAQISIQGLGASLASSFSRASAEVARLGRQLDGVQRSAQRPTPGIFGIEPVSPTLNRQFRSDRGLRDQRMEARDSYLTGLQSGVFSGRAVYDVNKVSPQQRSDFRVNDKLNQQREDAMKKEVAARSAFIDNLQNGVLSGKSVYDVDRITPEQRTNFRVNDKLNQQREAEMAREVANRKEFIDNLRSGQFSSQPLKGVDPIDPETQTRIALNKANRDQRLKAESEFTKGLEAAAKERQRMMSNFTSGLMGGLGLSATFAAAEIARKGLKGIGDLDDSLAGLRVGGYSQVQIAQMHKDALATDVPGMTTSEKLDTQRLLGNVIGKEAATPEVNRSLGIMTNAVMTATGRTDRKEVENAILRSAEASGNYTTGGRFDAAKFSKTILQVGQDMEALGRDVPLEGQVNSRQQGSTYYKALDIENNPQLRSALGVANEQFMGRGGTYLNQLVNASVSGLRKQGGLLQGALLEQGRLDTSHFVAYPTLTGKGAGATIAGPAIKGVEPGDVRGFATAIHDVAKTQLEGENRRAGKGAPTELEVMGRMSTFIGGGGVGTELMRFIAKFLSPEFAEAQKQYTERIAETGQTIEEQEKRSRRFRQGLVEVGAAFESLVAELAEIGGFTNFLYNFAAGMREFAKWANTDTGKNLVGVATTIVEVIAEIAALRLAIALLGKTAKLVAPELMVAGKGKGGVVPPVVPIPQAGSTAGIAEGAVVGGAGVAGWLATKGKFLTENAGRMLSHGIMAYAVAEISKSVFENLVPSFSGKDDIEEAINGAMIGSFFPGAAKIPAMILGAILDPLTHRAIEGVKKGAEEYENYKKSHPLENVPAYGDMELGDTIPRSWFGSKTNPANPDDYGDPGNQTRVPSTNVPKPSPAAEAERQAQIHPQFVPTYRGPTRISRGQMSASEFEKQEQRMIREVRNEPTTAHPHGMFPPPASIQMPDLSTLTPRTITTGSLIVTGTMPSATPGVQTAIPTPPIPQSVTESNAATPGVQTAIPTPPIPPSVMPPPVSSPSNSFTPISPMSGRPMIPPSNFMFHGKGLQSSHGTTLDDSNEQAWNFGTMQRSLGGIQPPSVGGMHGGGKGSTTTPMTKAVNTTLTPQMRGLLDTIADKESRGSYTAQNPNSSAYGRYQFINGTWQWVASQTGLSAKTPENQDKNAAWLAATMYAKKFPGRDLNTDLLDPAKAPQIAAALNSTWPSLPGGSQQLTTQADYSNRLAGHIAAEGMPGEPKRANLGLPGGASAADIIMSRTGLKGPQIDRSQFDLPDKNQTIHTHTALNVDGEDVASVIAKHFIDGGPSTSPAPTGYDTKMMAWAPGASLPRV